MILVSDASDRDLECRVQRFLRDKNYPSLGQLGVTVDHGVVRLTGTVSSFYEKQLAISCVRRVADVRQLDISIDVAPQA